MDFYREQKTRVDGVPAPFDCHAQQHWDEGVMAPAHIHDYIEILYCRCGQCEIQLNEKTHRFGDGDMVLINSLEIHRITALGAGLHAYIVIKFEPELLYSAEQTIFELKYLLPFTLQSVRHQKVFPQTELQTTCVPALMVDILAEFQAHAYGFELAIRANICRVFLWILRTWHQQDARLLCPSDIDGAAMRNLQRVFDYVLQNYAENVHLSDASRLCSMSYSAFSKFFTKYTHKRFVDYLTSVRITQSELLLASTDKPVTEIAYATGFATTSYFITRFKAANGMTPKQFRKRLQAEA